VGEFSDPNGLMLEKGQIFRLDLDSALGDNTRVMLPHPEIIEASEIGHVLLVDDGKVKLVVSGKYQKRIESINIPMSIHFNPIRSTSYALSCHIIPYLSINLFFFSLQYQLFRKGARVS
jgi:hypothetical protein